MFTDKVFFYISRIRFQVSVHQLEKCTRIPKLSENLLIAVTAIMCAGGTVWGVTLQLTGYFLTLIMFPMTN